MALCISSGPLADALASIRIGSAASLPSSVISTRSVILSSSETEIVAQEWVAKGSHFFTILRAFYRSIFALGAEFGCFGMFVCLFFAALFTPALLYAAVAETLLKYLLRSRITSTLERSGDGTKVAFTLRGPVALLVHIDSAQSAIVGHQGERTDRTVDHRVDPLGHLWPAGTKRTAGTGEAGGASSGASCSGGSRLMA